MKRNRIIWGIVSLVVLTTIAISFGTMRSHSQQDTSKTQGNQDFAQMEIPVVIKPLKVENRTIPVEIQCNKVFVSKPDTIDSFSCTLINRTDMDIGVVRVEYSLITETNSSDRFSYLAIANIHPDIPTLIKPNETLHISPVGPRSINGAVIKRLELEPTFIEFVGGWTVGVSDIQSITRIANIRKGAEMYKSWIKKEYVNRGKSENALIPLLETESELDPTNADNSDNKFGAKYYKNFLNKRFKENGQGSIKDVLDQ